MSITRSNINIVRVLSLALVTIVFAFGSFVQTSSAQSQSQLNLILDALRNNPELFSQLQDAIDTDGDSPVLSSSSCYEWERNLGAGSTGQDVLELQKFLNGDPDTRVATTGVGSVGSETTFYGPATANAVSRFQEKYASEILTPLGLTQGTGYFYNRTREYANELCEDAGTPVAVGGDQETSAAEVRVTGGNHPLNGVAVANANRVPFTVFSITAPSTGSVEIERVIVRRTGLSNDDSIDEVYLLDRNGNQFGNARGLNRDSEAVIGDDLRLSRGQSAEFTIVADIAPEDEADGGEVVSLEVVALRIDGERVNLQNGIRGAIHTINDSIDLPELELSIESDDGAATGSPEEIEVGDKKTFFAFELEETGEDDVYLHSITIEQLGSMDADDLDLELEVGSDDYPLRRSGDRFTATFDDPILIEDGEDLDFEVVGVAERGDDRTVQFAVYEETDIYATSRDFGYGVTIVTEGDDEFVDDEAEGGRFIVDSGSGGGGSENVDDDDVSIEAEDQILGIFEIEVEGETIDFEDVDFTVAFNPTSTSSRDNDYDNPTIEDLKIYQEDERLIADAADVEFDARDSSGDGQEDTETGTFEGSFDLEDGDHKIYIRGTLDDEFLAGDEIQFTINGFDRARGEDSRDNYSDSEFFGSGGEDLDVITATEGEFSVRWLTQKSQTVVAGADSVEFGTLELDADDSDGDITVDEVTIEFAASSGGDLDDVDNCAFYDGDDNEAERVGDEEDAESSVSFDLDDLQIEENEEVELVLFCDVDDDAAIGDEYRATLVSVEYEDENNDDRELVEDRDSFLLTVTGTGEIDIDFEDDFNDSIEFLSLGDDEAEVKVGEIEIEAENEDITVKELSFQLEITAGGSDVSSDTAFRDIVSKIEVRFDGDTGSESDFDDNGVATIDDLSFEIPADDVETIEVYATINGIDDKDATGTAGAFIRVKPYYNTKTIDFIEARGKASNQDLAEADVTGVSSSSYLGDGFVTHRAAPEFTEGTINQTLGNGTETLYEIVVSAPDAGGVSITKLTFDVDISDANAASVLAVTDLYVELENGDDKLTADTAIGTNGVTEMSFTEAETINAGESKTFVLRATVANSAEDDSVSTRLLFDADNADGDGGDSVADLSSRRVIWSPHSDTGRGTVDPTENDWFDGGSLDPDDQLDDITIDR